MKSELSRRLAAEFVGTSFLLIAVVGSGIMGAKLAGGNVAIALLANSLATGAALYVLITMFGSISGAHFNPAVSLVLCRRGSLSTHDLLFYCLAQVAGGLLGVFAAHAMFELPLLQFATTARTGLAQLFSEFVASAGLVLTIIGVVRAAPGKVASSVALYILGAYWFTASTSFANPAVTIARAWTDTFAGIAPHDVIGFIAAQVAGALAAQVISGFLFEPTEKGP